MNVKPAGSVLASVWGGITKKLVKIHEHFLLGQKLILHPERALFWQEKKVLIVADAHFGKAQGLRDDGIPIPLGTTATDLERLSDLMDRFHPRKLIFLGDLTHVRLGEPAHLYELFNQWRRRHTSAEITLVTGNHDRHTRRPPSQLRIDRVAAEIFMDPFHFIHVPPKSCLFYTLAGHLHPAVSLEGSGRQKEVLPCFCFGPRTALVPAFGSFTGNHVIYPNIDDRIFVIANQHVLKVSSGQPTGPS